MKSALFAASLLTVSLALPSALIIQKEASSSGSAIYNLAATPSAGHGISNYSDYTILEILEQALQRHDSVMGDEDDPSFLPLHRIAYLVNLSTEAQKKLSGDSVTFLAPDDAALTPPRRNAQSGEQRPHIFHENDHDHDDERRERFKEIVTYVLRYHTLDGTHSTDELADKSTIATTLVPGGAESEEPAQRLRIEATYQILPYPHPVLEFNFFAKKVGNTIIAKNGIIHVINAPLLPPFTPLNDLFLFPTFFSALTSAVQRVGLAGALLPETTHNLVEEILEDFEESHKVKEFTIFAPTNFAFDRLGLETLAFLNSPFPISRKVLKYVLAYHVVPDITFHSDFIHNSTDLDAFKTAESFAEDKNTTTYRLPTLLSKSGVNPNATLTVDVVSYRRFGSGPVRREVLVKQPRDEHHNQVAPVSVYKADGVARGGAIHSVNSILRPPYHRQQKHDDEHMHQALARFY